MGLFDKFKKEKEVKSTVEKADRVSIFDTDYQIDKSNWFQVYSACLGSYITIQEACSEKVVKGRAWNADLAKGTLSFGDSVYPVQFIGSESNSSGTWLWGWENLNGFGEHILKFTNETKKLGELWNLEPLTISQFEISDTFNGHSLATVACGISKEKYCYYRGPHSNGAVLMAFSNVPNEVYDSVNLQTFMRITLDTLQNVSVDHKIFIESYLMWNGTKYEWIDGNIVAHFDEDLLVEFEQIEEFFRVKSLKTNFVK